MASRRASQDSAGNQAVDRRPQAEGRSEDLAAKGANTESDRGHTEAGRAARARPERGDTTSRCSFSPYCASGRAPDRVTPRRQSRLRRLRRSERCGRQSHAPPRATRCRSLLRSLYNRRGGARGAAGASGAVTASDSGRGRGEDRRAGGACAALTGPQAEARRVLISALRTLSRDASNAESGLVPQLCGQRSGRTHHSDHRSDRRAFEAASSEDPDGDSACRVGEGWGAVRLCVPGRAAVWNA